MTCIVGIIDYQNQKIIMAGDSAGVRSSDIFYRKDPKVFQNGEYILGFTSSFRMGQILQYEVYLPPMSEDCHDVFEHMVTIVIPIIRKSFHENGYLTKYNDQEYGGEFLIGYRDRLFLVDTDFQIGESLQNFHSCGSGQQLALGSFHTTQKLNLDARVRCELALDSASYYSSECSPPYNFVSLPF